MKGNRGEWYVVVQSVLILAVVLSPFAAERPADYPVLLVVVGGLLCAFGLAVVALSSKALGPNLSPFPKPREEGSLVQSGIFSVVRHPIYSGFVLFALGWSLVWGSVPALLATLVLLAFFDLKARREERWLEAKFSGYAAYKGRVRKLIPFLY